MNSGEVDNTDGAEAPGGGVKVELKEEDLAEAGHSVTKPTPTEAGVKVEVNQGGGEAAAERLPTIMASSKSFEPPAFVSETKSYSEYKSDLYMWSRITQIPKKSQAEVVVYNLEGHKSRIKEKVVLNIGEKIKDSEEGIDELIKFLDTIYKKDEMADAWTKYKNFQKIKRIGNSTINDFISEFEKEYILAKSAGCEYSDTLIAFRLLEATVLSDMDEKFVLTGVNYDEAKSQKNLYEQIKASLKKFQGRNDVVGEERGMRFDPALIAGVAEVLLSQGWKKPGGGGRRRSNTDPGEVAPESKNTATKRNSSAYKGKKNPLGKDGKPLACFKCGDIYHMRDRCPKLTNLEMSMITVDNKSCTLLDRRSETKIICDGHEIVMVTYTEEHLCLMVEEAGERGVIDSACSKTSLNP